MRSLDVGVERLRLAAPFRISGYVFEALDVVVATIGEGGHQGRGEAAGVYYLGDDVDRMVGAIELARPEIECGLTRTALQSLMPAGGARNAIDCALWELEARTRGTSVAALAGLPTPKPLLTTFTIGADSPEQCAAGARGYAQARALKLKLTGSLEEDLERVAAVRAARPEAWLGVDANQGYDRPGLERLVAGISGHRVSLIEQPLKRGREADLADFSSPIPIAADESVLTLADLRGLVGRFDVVNIKLDKSGGLTEALRMAAEVRALGMKVMVGNMVGTSLAIAPAWLLGQLCDLVDLDGPIFLAEDREPSVVYRDGLVDCPADVWGSPDRLAA